MLAGDAAVIGAGGAIGSAVAGRLTDHDATAKIHLFSSQVIHGGCGKAQIEQVSYEPTEIANACRSLRERLSRSQSELTRVVVCNGQLHGGALLPEKRIESISQDGLMASFQANSIVPILWLQGLMPMLQQTSHAVVAFLSARVGSIEDNTKGGWYGYRSSKTALNMLLRTASVEMSRRAPGVSLLAFQPGTTMSELSKPFLNNVPPGQAFTPDFVADRLVGIMDQTPPGQPLQFIDWAGKPIPW